MIKKLFYINLLSFLPLTATMKLTSPAFDHNQEIPAQYTCDGANISPALAWSGAPSNTNGFALVVDDPDAPSKVWVHWIVFNIPDTTNHLNENTITGPFLLGSTDFDGKQGYGGPCPPKGTHRYQFTLYALDTLVDLHANATKQELLEAMQGHILEKATLIGTYQKQNK